MTEKWQKYDRNTTEIDTTKINRNITAAIQKADRNPREYKN